MGIWLFVLVLLNILLLLSLIIFGMKFLVSPKDDPRLSKGLQLLQSKITILEDLSDRTDRQVMEMASLLDRRSREVQKVLLDANGVIEEIETSMKKSLQIAEMYQEKIPHEDIVDRQNSLKYIKAAQMSHQGLTDEEIAESVGLNLGEVSLIAKMNRRDGLDFQESEAESTKEIQEVKESPVISKPGIQRYEFPRLS